MTGLPRLCYPGEVQGYIAALLTANQSPRLFNCSNNLHTARHLGLKCMYYQMSFDKCMYSCSLHVFCYMKILYLIYIIYELHMQIQMINYICKDFIYGMKNEVGLSEKWRKSSKRWEVEKRGGSVREVCSHYVTHLSEMALGNSPLCKINTSSYM